MKKTLAFLFLAVLLITAITVGTLPAYAYSETSESENNNTVSQADRVYKDYMIYAEISKNDIDYFKFVLESDRNIGIGMASESDATVFAVLDSDGYILGYAECYEQNDDGVYVYSVGGTLKKGTYYIAVYDEEYYNYTYGFMIALEDAHTHSYTKRNYDEGTHWYECECGQMTKNEKHYGETNKNIVPATLTSNGGITAKCDGCGYYYERNISQIRKVSLSSSSLSYTSKTVTPTVKVTDTSGKSLKENVDYTVSYPSESVNIGKYDVTVTFKGNYAGEKTLTYSILPAAVSKVTATQSTSEVTLTWDKVDRATGYRVYKYNFETNGWDKAVSATKKTTATITGLEAGEDYTFAVRSYSKTDSGTFWAKTYTKIETSTKPATPVVRTASTAIGRATVAWNDVDGETGYQVWYSENKSTGYKKLSNYKANTVKIYKTGLTAGKTYYFRVRAYKSVGGKLLYSSYSNVASVKIKTLAAPTARTASTAKGRATVAWTDVAGESGYQVWYSESKTKGFKKLSNYKADTVKMYKTGLTSGKTYYFKVRAYKLVDGKYVYSPYSNVASLKIK